MAGKVEQVPSMQCECQGHGQLSRLHDKNINKYTCTHDFQKYKYTNILILPGYNINKQILRVKLHLG